MAALRTVRISASCFLVVASLATAFACSSSDSGDKGGSNGSDGSAGGAGNGSGGAASGSGGSGTGTGGFGGDTLKGVDGSIIADLCATSGCPQCADGKDNDGDGQADGFDTECTGPLDNDEGSFATGIPGDNRDPKWQDCFFDGNSGAGDDGCRYATECLTGDLPQSDADCTLTQQCMDFCKRLLPNGCDCFGCCTISTAQGDVDVEIGTGCSVDKLNDATACPPCTKSTTCQNTCGTCELCLGKTVEDLPPSCGTPPPDAGSPMPDAEPPPPYTCDQGRQVCTASADCPLNYYCQQGCCLPIIQ